MSWFQIFLKQPSVAYALGDVIFRRDDVADRMFVVAEGEVEIAIGDTVLDIVGPEGIFGEMALVSKEPAQRDGTSADRLPYRRDPGEAFHLPHSGNAPLRARGDAGHGEPFAPPRSVTVEDPDQVNSSNITSSM